jgi:hypothetical protein
MIKEKQSLFISRGDRSGKEPVVLACLARSYPAHRNDRSSYGVGLSSVSRRHPSPDSSRATLDS